MSINNREDANKYYKIVNDLIDEYVEKHKIRPNNLKNYLKPGSKKFLKFLERNKLKDINGISVILKDVIDDRSHMENDGVITFESFKLFESVEYKISSLEDCIKKGIEKSDISMEKIIADFYDTNLSSIDIVDSPKHKFKVDNWDNDQFKVIIYSKEDLEIIKNNIIEFLFNDLSIKKINLSDIIKIDLLDLINDKKFKDKILELINDEKTIEIISSITKFKFKDNFKDHYIWYKHVTS